MKLSISNIAWDQEHDQEIYSFLKINGVSGIEIAPTRIFKENPYDCNNAAKDWSLNLFNDYGLSIVSMQSILFGKTQNIFNGKKDFEELISYCKKAIEFASSISCNNLVFGCPKNRNIPNNLKDTSVAIDFFKELALYAESKNTVLSIEANPTIYNTNFINTTTEAIDFVKIINSDGFKVNLDIGTIIENNENLFCLEGNCHFINHVHISEPFLNMIQHRFMHDQLINILMKEHYSGYVSIEMKNLNDLQLVKDAVLYILEITNKFCGD